MSSSNAPDAHERQMGELKTIVWNTQDRNADIAHAQAGVEF